MTLYNGLTDSNDFNHTLNNPMDPSGSDDVLQVNADTSGDTNSTTPT